MPTGSDPITIEVVEDKELEGRSSWRSSILSRGVLSQSRPVLVAVNRRGERHRLFDETHWDEAEAKRDRLRQELATSDPHHWCDRSAIPVSFLS